MPLLVSCRETSAAARPPPTMTTLRCGSCVAMAVSSAEIRDGLGMRGARKALAAVCRHVLRMQRRQARVTHELPERLVPVPSVQRIGEARLHEQRIQRFVE